MTRDTPSSNQRGVLVAVGANFRMGRYQFFKSIRYRYNIGLLLSILNSHLHQVHQSGPEFSSCILLDFFKNIFTVINYKEETATVSKFVKITKVQGFCSVQFTHTPKKPHFQNPTLTLRVG